MTIGGRGTLPAPRLGSMHPRMRGPTSASCGTAHASERSAFGAARSPTSSTNGPSRPARFTKGSMVELTVHYSNLHDLLVELRRDMRCRAFEELPGTARPRPRLEHLHLSSAPEPCVRRVLD